ncbi:transmembrane protein 225B [Tenrec ecaudatus]|uniref:transmembrane protein 225B n=1 Tax=Tenrec ecaudatus TaxID=94439 RepID=UPI003F5A8D74
MGRHVAKVIASPTSESRPQGVMCGLNASLSIIVQHQRIYTREKFCVEVNIVLGWFFLLSAVFLSCLTTFMMVSFAPQLLPRIRKCNYVSASISFLEGTCAFLALLLHALEIRTLRMKPSPPPTKFSVQWSYYMLGSGSFLFIAASTTCLLEEATYFQRNTLPISQTVQEAQGRPPLERLESLGGELSSVQKETLLQGETAIQPQSRVY